jgi:hypothetical protein
MFKHMSTAEALNALATGVVREICWDTEDRFYSLKDGCVWDMDRAQDRGSLKYMLKVWSELTDRYGNKWSGSI